GLVIVATLLYFLVLDVNFTSLHRHYRKKLAEAYLIQPVSQPPPPIAQSTTTQSTVPSSTPPRTTTAQPMTMPNGPPTVKSNVALLLSETAAQPRRPYHLINCALNVPGSRNQSMQGRLTDFFVFSRDYCGSPLTGYRPTTEWEKLDPNLDVGTAMAISGAA